MQKIIFLLMLCIASYFPTFCQEIKGKVISESSEEPLGNVTIENKKNSTTTTTNDNGEFSIVSNNADSFIFSRIGFKPREILLTPSKQFLTVTLIELDSSLSEVNVISTGYQTLRGNKITGSVQVLDRKALMQQVGTNILDRLNNIAPGVMLDTKADKGDLQKLNISIRGLSTINGPRDPLIVLDGFIYEGEIENIDPNSIESVTILKDAAASSIWGARAGNGVIVLTTKKGNANRKIAVQLNESVTVKDKTNLHKVFQMPAKDFIEIEKVLFKNGYYDNDFGYYPYLAHTPAIDYLQMEKNGTLSSSDLNAKLTELSRIDGRDEYSKYFLHNPVLQQYGVSVSGGSNINTFNLGLNYTNDLNENSGKFRKVNINLANRFTPTKKTTLDLNVYYTNSTTSAGSPAYSSYSVNLKQYPYVQFADKDGNPIVFEDSYRKLFTDSMFGGRLQSWSYYPLNDYKYVDNETKIQELYASLNGSYEILPFLKATVGYQVQQQTNLNDVRYDPESYFARSTVNQFANLDETGNLIFPVPKGGIRSINNSVTTSYTIRGQMDVNKAWKNQSLLGVLGWEMRQNKNESNGFTAYGYTDDPLKTVAVNYQENYPLYINQYTWSIPGAPSFGQNINRFVSTYANLIYVLMNRYGLSASMRRDGANIFGATTNDKWKPFMSFGAYWNLSGEDFLSASKIDLLKLRVSYGFSGNVDLRKTPLPIASNATNTYTSFPALGIGTLNDPSLRWERIRTFNLGLDFSLFQRVITGSVDYYRKKGSDLYGLSAYDYTVWGRQFTITRNMGGMQGNGIDLLLTARNINRKLKWFTTYNFSINKNKTTSYYSVNPLNEAYFLGGDGSVITPIPGLPLNAISAYKWAGLDHEGNPQGYVDGKPSTDYDAIFKEAFAKGSAGNMVYVGSAKPQYWGSLINQVSYKNFLLSFNISYQGGYYFFRNTTGYYTFFAKGLAYPDIMERWQNPGDETKTNVPSLQYPSNSIRDGFYNHSEINVQKGDHIRFQYLNLSYEPYYRSKSNRSSARVFVNVSNLGILWRANKDKIDPEYPDQIGPLKTYTIGLNLTF